jgi:hypothetical protein
MLGALIASRSRNGHVDLSDPFAGDFHRGIRAAHLLNTTPKQERKQANRTRSAQQQEGVDSP